MWAWQAMLEHYSRPGLTLISWLVEHNGMHCAGSRCHLNWTDALALVDAQQSTVRDQRRLMCMTRPEST